MGPFSCMKVAWIHHIELLARNLGFSTDSSILISSGMPMIAMVKLMTNCTHAAPRWSPMKPTRGTLVKLLRPQILWSSCQNSHYKNDFELVKFPICWSVHIMFSTKLFISGISTYTLRFEGWLLQWCVHMPPEACSVYTRCIYLTTQI